jgi:hypothetical protein
MTRGPGNTSCLVTCTSNLAPAQLGGGIFLSTTTYTMTSCPDSPVYNAYQNLIGYVRTINAEHGSTYTRYYGMQGENPGTQATGALHETYAQAEQDVRDWAAGKEVAYVKHAEVPLPAQVKEKLGIARLADAAAAGATYPTK